MFQAVNLFADKKGWRQVCRGANRANGRQQLGELVLANAEESKKKKKKKSQGAQNGNERKNN